MVDAPLLSQSYDGSFENSANIQLSAGTYLLKEHFRYQSIDMELEPTNKKSKK